MCLVNHQRDQLGPEKLFFPFSFHSKSLSLPLQVKNLSEEDEKQEFKTQNTKTLIH